MLKRRYVVRALVVVLAIALALYVPTPYYALCPGPVIDLGEVVAIDGQTEPGGGVRLLSVAATQSSPAFLIYAALHPTIDITHRNRLFPAGMDLESYLEYAEGQMQRSQAVAEVVAAREAGIGGTIQGGGLQVSSVAASSPWRGRLKVGDVITGVDGEDTQLLETFARSLPEGQRLVVDRGGRQVTVPYEHVDLESGARDLRRILRGVVLENLPWSVDVPFDVQISVDEVRGPSAALALSLEIYRRLAGFTVLTNQVVAATGTLQMDGRVGRVGGITQKLAAARQSDVTLVLLPQGGPSMAQNGDVRILTVDTFERAVSHLGDAAGHTGH